MKTRSNFLLLLLMGTYFKFYFPNIYNFDLITTLIFYLHFIIYRRVHNFSRALRQVCSLAKYVAGSLELNEK